MCVLSGRRGVGLVLFAFSLGFFAFAPAALAGPPTHPRTPSLDISGGLNHACGVAVDSRGDLYVASAGESKVNVYDPSHTLLTSIADSNEPCGLAVNSKGELYVSEGGTGKVVQLQTQCLSLCWHPDLRLGRDRRRLRQCEGHRRRPPDDRLYVAEGTTSPSTKPTAASKPTLGEPALIEASGVAAYTSPRRVTALRGRRRWKPTRSSSSPRRLRSAPRLQRPQYRRPEAAASNCAARAPQAACLRLRRRWRLPRRRPAATRKPAGPNAPRSRNRPAPPGTSSSMTPPTMRSTSSTPLANTSTRLAIPPSPTPNRAAMAIDRSGGANDGTIYLGLGRRRRSKGSRLRAAGGAEPGDPGRTALPRAGRGRSGRDRLPRGRLYDSGQPDQGLQPQRHRSQGRACRQRSPRYPGAAGRPGGGFAGQRLCVGGKRKQ